MDTDDFEQRFCPSTFARRPDEPQTRSSTTSLAYSTESFHTARDNVPCLVKDDEDPSERGSPVTPLQPLRAFSFYSLQPADHSKSMVENQASKPSDPQTRLRKLHSAVETLGYTAATSSRICRLLEMLPRKEQAMCLFNEAFLKKKVADALDVIAAEDEESEQEL